MIDLFDSGSLPALARAVLAVLFDLTLKGALILALAGLLTRMLKTASAATRHLIWSLALCSVLLLPILTVVLPAWRVPVLAEIPYLREAATSLNPEAAQEPPSAIPVEVVLTDAPGVENAALEQPGAVATAPKSVPVRVVGAFSSLYDTARAAPWPVWLLFIWTAGVAVVLFRFLLGVAGVGWLAYRARPVRGADWIRLTDDIRRRLGVRRRVRLLRSVRTAMPMTWGLWQPVVLVPVRADAWSEARRRCVLTHELAHVRRWDCLTQTLAQVACAVSWFNPLVWIAARQMRHDRELACDDYVLGCDVRPSDYAAHLLDIARTTRSTLVVPLGAVAMARPSKLESRVLSILDTARKRGALGRMATVGSAVLTVGLVLPLAAMHPAGDEAASTANQQAFQRVATEQGEAYQWAGRIDPGQTVDVRGIRGHVQATPSSGKAVEVMALPRDQAFSGEVRVVEQEGGLVICLPDPDNPDACAADTQHNDVTDDQPTVDIVALIPRGVHFSGQTLDGDVTVVGLHSDVEVLTVDGDIFVQATGRVSAHAVEGDVKLRTASYARASTRAGDIHARIGRTDWAGAMPFDTDNGDITVELPENAHTDIDLHVEADGHLKSVISMRRQTRLRQTRQEGERFRGRLGQGGRLLAIHTKDGNITITHLGNQTVKPLHDIEVRPQKDAARPDRPVYRAEARPAPQKTSPPVAEARRRPTEQPAQDAAPRARRTDLDLEANLARLRRQVGRLDAVVSGELFETAARAINDLDLGVSFTRRDLVELVEVVDGNAPRYARQLQRLGLDEFTREELLLARLFGVNAGYVWSVRDAGYCPSLKELVAMKIAGVDAQYLKDMASEGYEELPVEDLVELRTSGVDKEVIHEMEEQGIHAPSVEEMVEYQAEHGPMPR